MRYDNIVKDNMRACFSLVELLVVIAIISVLSSLLLPALKNARETTKTIACVNNMKQIGLGLNMYMNDYTEWLPLTSTRNEYAYFLNDYLKSGFEKKDDTPCHIIFGNMNSVFVCPSLSKVETSYNWLGESDASSTYLASYSPTWQYSDDSSTCGGWLPAWDPFPFWNNRIHRRFTTIKSNSAIMSDQGYMKVDTAWTQAYIAGLPMSGRSRYGFGTVDTYPQYALGWNHRRMITPMLFTDMSVRQVKYQKGAEIFGEDWVQK